MHLIPFCFSIFVKMPSPLFSVPKKVPSYIFPHPHDGDFVLRIASVQFAISVIFIASSAPFLNCSVLSSPFFVNNFPLTISAGSLGVGSPPSCSGQTGIALPCLTRSITFWHGFAFPSYLHGTPAKHSDTTIIV